MFLVNSLTVTTLYMVYLQSTMYSLHKFNNYFWAQMLQFFLRKFVHIAQCFFIIYLL